MSVEGETVPITVVVAFLGMLVAVGSQGCLGDYSGHPRGLRMVGVPIHIIGVLGYSVIVVACVVHPLAGLITVGLAALFTIYLVHRAAKIQLTCPMCYLAWALNAMMLMTAILGL